MNIDAKGTENDTPRWLETLTMFAVLKFHY